MGGIEWLEARRAAPTDKLSDPVPGSERIPETSPHIITSNRASADFAVSFSTGPVAVEGPDPRSARTFISVL